MIYFIVFSTGVLCGILVMCLISVASDYDYEKLEFNSKDDDKLE